jgi:hypothetical protein
MDQKRYGLSKSRISAFLQCPKRLWLEIHHPELKQESDGTRRSFVRGHQLGDLARAQYPTGLLVGHDDDLSNALSQTEEIFSKAPALPVFEATFQHEGVLVRADLMLPEEGGWHMAEVKSTGSAKAQHTPDLAVQTWVAEHAGISVSRSTIRHINMSFVYPGDGHYEGLLADTDIKDELKDAIPLVPIWVAKARETLEGTEPKRNLGPHCESPYECPFIPYCESKAKKPPGFPVSLLPGPSGKKIARSLIAEGFEDLTTVPASKITNEQMRWIHDATTSGEVYRNAQAARVAVANWSYPRAFLDFETISFGVPIWIGTSPYQQIPFQWSCHVQAGDGSTQQREFLDLTGDDPSRRCAEELVERLSDCKTVITYQASFERGVIQRLANLYPDLSIPLRSIANRIVDLLPLVRQSYYHRDMLGSYSIKDVLPTMSNALNYQTIGEVQDGEMAGVAYLEATDSKTPSQRKTELDKSLRAYCGLDSRAMMVVLETLVS